MTIRQDLTGRTFGKLLVLGESHRDTSGKTYWHCVCDCGGVSNPRGSSLTTGNTVSCGCTQGAHNPIDLTGRVFGKLTVVKMSHKDHKGRYHWLCQCSCGKTSTPVGGQLTGGGSTTCGCGTGSRRIDLTGRVYGRLTVIGPDHKDKQGKTYWKCSCSCGGTSVVQGANLRNPKGTKSCGCLVTEAFLNYRVNGGEARLAGIASRRKYPTPEYSAQMNCYNSYKTGAKRRGLSWDLSFDKFVAITKQPCAYCGELPELRPGAAANIDINSSGVDRVDNMIGYTDSNTVPCCKWCNTAKMHHTMTDFINHCRAVAAKFELLRGAA